MQNEFVTPKSIFPAIPPALAGHGTSDDVLVNRVAAGNRLAMHVLFARHHARVYRFILRWVGDASTRGRRTPARSFSSLWRQADQFKAQSSVSTWLLAIARHKAVAELRRRRAGALGEEVHWNCRSGGRSAGCLAGEGSQPGPAAVPHATFARAPRADRPRLLPRKVDRRDRGDRRYSQEYREDPRVLRAQEAG